jgi:STE24 endopeptidase
VAELVAIVAHEVGHYKLRHIWTHTALGVLHTGAVFFVLSLFLSRAGLFDAFFMENRSVYAGLVFFGLLFTPVDLGLSVFLNMVLRRHEFEADAFAARTTGDSRPLITALKTLASDSLTNLTPHPLHVVLHDSHPPVVQRIARLRALGS